MAAAAGTGPRRGPPAHADQVRSRYLRAGRGAGTEFSGAAGDRVRAWVPAARRRGGAYARGGPAGGRGMPGGRAVPVRHPARHRAGPGGAVRRGARVHRAQGGPDPGGARHPALRGPCPAGPPDHRDACSACPDGHDLPDVDGIRRVQRDHRGQRTCRFIRSLATSCRVRTSDASSAACGTSCAEGYARLAGARPPAPCPPRAPASPASLSWLSGPARIRAGARPEKPGNDREDVDRASALLAWFWVVTDVGSGWDPV